MLKAGQEEKITIRNQKDHQEIPNRVIALLEYLDQSFITCIWFHGIT